MSTNLVDYTSAFVCKTGDVRYNKMIATLKYRATITYTLANNKLMQLAKHYGMTRRNVVQLDLPAGFTCPMAHLCQAFADRNTGAQTKGKDSQFVCYASKAESAFPTVRLMRWKNLEILENARRTGGVQGMVDALESSFPKTARIVRIHSSGDIYNGEYWQALKTLASNHPGVVFFAYTKILDYVRDVTKPSNLRMIYSFGGRQDNRLTEDVPVCRVVTSYAEAESLGLDVICDNDDNDYQDYDYIVQGKSFALLVH